MGPKKRRLLAFLVMPAFVLGACDDGGSETSPDASTSPTEAEDSAPASAPEYVATLCTEMSDWLADLQALQAQVQSSVEPGASPQEAQEALRTFFDDAIGATDAFIGAIRDVGIPGVDDGERIHNDLLAKFDDVKGALEDARAEVENLPLDDRAAFATEAARLRESVTTQFQSIGAALATLSQPDLDAAAAEEPACSGISPTGG